MSEFFNESGYPHVNPAGSGITFERDIVNPKDDTLEDRIETQEGMITLVSILLAATVVGFGWYRDDLGIRVYELILAGLGTLVVSWFFLFTLFTAPLRREKIERETGRPVGFPVLDTLNRMHHGQQAIDGEIYDTRDAIPIIHREIIDTRNAYDNEYHITSHYLMITNRSHRVIHVSYTLWMHFENTMYTQSEPRMIVPPRITVVDNPQDIHDLIVNIFGEQTFSRILDQKISIRTPDGWTPYVFKSEDWTA